ncbi:MAG: SusD/RagB family nutrient-binding outer membrane lipoprotein, partial [Williamsia sp.]|nr:SusD/RagB family nutrient-binding outer membrane lipoprotein [Williamsia sp.]
MKKLVICQLCIAILIGNLSGGCRRVFDDAAIENNPNAVTNVDVTTLLAGTILGTAFLHEETDARIASLWSGELNGLSRAHLGFAQYIVSSQTFSWKTMYPVAGQARLVQTKADAVGDKWTKGVGQVLEVLVIAKATDLYGDVPYSQAFDETAYPTPVFDRQEDIY